ncbi:MAG: NAD(P)/FAD-dependent oxidoreductase [Spirochaetes bacterium]|jgi:nitrite reductase (NADH) large subunit|nr:NAD(P)/FAD-dependent oxidoreductase [Spirochaetota bacterium]
MKFVIIGNGPAGVDCALEIRKNDPDAEITIISKESFSFYYRPKLVEYIAEDILPEKIIIYKKDFFESKKINQVLSCEILRIDRESKTVFSDNISYDYDKLLIASGSLPLIPAEGFNRDSVYVLRSFSDAVALKKAVKEKKKFLISGGGLLGLEIANSIALTGKNVTVCEFMPFLLSRQCDEGGGKFLEKLLRSRGLKFIFSDSIVSYDGKNAEFASGMKESFDAIIISSGVLPSVMLAKNCGLSIAKGILTDSTFRTSDPDIYAAGDCAEIDGHLCGLWMTAKEQGRIAGANMSGIKSYYKPLISSTVLKIAEIDFFSAGDYREDCGNVFRKSNDELYIRINYDQRIKAGIAIGSSQAANGLRAVISGKKELADFIAEYS